MNNLSSDKRHIKRKRILRQSGSPLLHLFSVRSLVLYTSFIVFLYLLLYVNPLSSSSFHPVLVVSSLSLLSSSSSSTSTITAKSVQDFGGLLLPLRIENRVLFPDHVLLLVSGGDKEGWVKRSGLDELECVYYGKDEFNRVSDESGDLYAGKVVSVDEYDEFRSIVRCTIPSGNYSDEANLRWAGKSYGLWVKNRRVVGSCSWENVAYAATLDGDTAVVFVKGLNLRADRESDPNPFTCHFGLGKWERSERYLLTTKALTTAQEVVRCALPRSMKNNPDKARGIRVTVGVTHYVHADARGRVLMPSVAKISNFGPEEGEKRVEAKYELCVCTMVWNQASAIREWIVYHSWLGVERWFIYDNNSDDGIEEVIQGLNTEGYNVTRHVWPWIKTQEAGFSHCALRAKERCNWVSFMDVDEYFYFTNPTPRHPQLGYVGENSLRALVTNFSSSSENIAEIRTSCHSFGPSGLNLRPEKGVMVGYTCRLQSPERHKSIIRPDALDPTLLNVVHHFHLRKGFRYLNLPLSTAIINHYKYQVWEVFRAKFYRRVATYVADWQQNQNEGSRDRAPGLGTEAIEPPDWPQRFCEVWDTGLRDFVLANLADVSTGLLPWEARPVLVE